MPPVIHPSTRNRTAPVFDPQDSVTRRDPFPLFAQLREHDPVHWSPALKAWVFTRYSDVRRVALNADMSPDRLTPFFDTLPNERRQTMADLIRYLNLWLVFRDPPAHARLRALVSKAFVPSAIEAWRPRIQAIVDDLLDRVVERGSMDLIGEFAFPLPASVIMDMLGVPRTDMEGIKIWSNDIALFIGTARGVPDKYERAQAGARAMALYFRGLIAERRANSRDDLMSALIAARDADDRLSEDELIATCILLLFAGHETTTNLIGNGLYAFMLNPTQWQILRENPALIESAVEEVLRYDGPSGALARVVRVGHAMHGRDLKQGDRVFAMLNAANRDPRQFDDPDRFDITRERNRHMTFGQGIHFCLGASLARMEGQIAIATIARRLPSIRPTVEHLEWLDALILRGLRALPVAFQPTAASR
jgi:cytochrome P450